MLCQYVGVEVRTPQGRADLVINAENKIYIIEVKIDRTSDFAVDQIDLKNYGERFLTQGKPIVKSRRKLRQREHAQHHRLENP